MTQTPPPIVLLNAFPVSRVQWEDLIDLWAQSEVGDRDILTFDMPGIGDMPATEAQPSLDLIADAAVAAMREATGHSSAVWVGCSMGGYVAMSVVHRHADAVAGLGLVATTSLADTDQARQDRLTLAESVETAEHVPDPHAMARRLVGRDDKHGQAVLEAVTRDIARHSGSAVAWGQRAMAARPDRTGVLTTLDAPAVVVLGERDRVISAERAAPMAQALSVEPVVIEHVGHLCAWEDPQQTAAALADLFR